MTLRVNIDGMGRLKDALYRASTDAGLVERHIRERAAMKPESEGMIQTLMMLHERAYPWGQQAARDTSTHADWAADGVDKAIKLYHSTDRHSAEALDDTYPRVVLPEMFTKRPGVDPSFVGPTPIGIPPASDFHDVVEPEHALNESLAFDTPNFNAKYNWLTDTLSPSAAVRAVIHAIFHKDIFAFFLKDISGDWDALYGCGSEWVRAADAIENIASNLFEHAAHLPTVWGGNGADGCELYLLQVDAAISSRVATYKSIGQAYHDAAQSAWTQFDLAGSFLSDVLDAAIAIAAGISGGIATSETVIGAIAGGGTAAWYAWKAWKAYESFTEIMDATQKLLDRLVNSVKLVEGIGPQLVKDPPGVLAFPSQPFHLPGS